MDTDRFYAAVRTGVACLLLGAIPACALFGFKREGEMKATQLEAMPSSVLSAGSKEELAIKELVESDSMVRSQVIAVSILSPWQADPKNPSQQILFAAIARAPKSPTASTCPILRKEAFTRQGGGKIEWDKRYDIFMPYDQRHGEVPCAKVGWPFQAFDEARAGQARTLVLEPSEGKSSIAFCQSHKGTPLAVTVTLADGMSLSTKGMGARRLQPTDLKWNAPPGSFVDAGAVFHGNEMAFLDGNPTVKVQLAKNPALEAKLELTPNFNCQALIQGGGAAGATGEQGAVGGRSGAAGGRGGVGGPGGDATNVDVYLGVVSAGKQGKMLLIKAIIGGGAPQYWLMDLKNFTGFTGPANGYSPIQVHAEGGPGGTGGTGGVGFSQETSGSGIHSTRAGAGGTGGPGGRGGRGGQVTIHASNPEIQQAIGSAVAIYTAGGDGGIGGSGGDSGGYGGNARPVAGGAMGPGGQKGLDGSSRVVNASGVDKRLASELSAVISRAKQFR